jgi:seryl-tRNA synthetase
VAKTLILSQINMDAETQSMFTKLLDRIAALSSLIRQLIREKADSSEALQAAQKAIEEKDALVAELRQTIEQQDAETVDTSELQQKLDELNSELDAVVQEATTANPGEAGGTTAGETTPDDTVTGGTATTGGTVTETPPAETATT